MIENYKHNPVAWVRDVLGYEPWDVQVDILNSLRDNRNTNVASCHGIGKTSISSVAALWFLMNHYPSTVLTTAPTSRQVKELLWAEIRRWWGKAKFELGPHDPASTSITLSGDKWRALGFTAREGDPTRFQGFHNDHVMAIGDEAAGLGGGVIDEGMEACLSSGLIVRRLLIGNPTDPQSQFAKECKIKEVDTKTIHVSAFDTPNFTHFGITLADIRNGEWRKKVDGPLPRAYLVSPDWVASRWKRWGEKNPLWISRVIGQFPKRDKWALIDPAWLQNSYKLWDKWAETGETPGGTGRRIVSDVARFGGDESTVGELWDGVFRIREAEIHQDTMTTTGMVANWYHRKPPEVNEEIVVDGDGLGGGVIDALREQGLPVLEFHGGAKPKFHAIEKPGPGQRRFLNRRAEAYWELAELLDPSKPGELALDPRDDELAGQLTSIRYKLRPDGAVQIESKEDMLKRGIPSPDRADTLMMAVDGGQRDFEFAFA